ncbi:MAG TPA: DUF4382 domain-containing protein [Gammaproteobacteria bacterium]|nr:DUF4382 domain-containing protein [Gammaproteobacteria bacterium]
MLKTRYSRIAAVVFAACAVTACSSGGSSDDIAAIKGSGTLSLSLVDAPIQDAAEIWIRIKNISLKPAGAGPAIDFPIDPPLEVNLLSLTPDSAATLLDGVKVPAGSYDWLAMDVDAEFDGVTNDSYVTTQAGGMEELRVPSGRLRLVSGLTITADQATSFMIDWNARMGLVHPPGQQGYMLRPAFRVVDMTLYGTVSGKVAAATIQSSACLADNPNDANAGNVVYVYAGTGVTPDDIDGTDPEPVATVNVEQNAAGDYVYKTLLSPGTYTLAFTCQAGNDDPDTDDTDTDPATADKVVFSSPVNVNLAADAAEAADF